MAVSHIHPRFHKELCPHRVEDSEPCRNNDGRGSVNKSVSTRQIMYSVLSLMGQVEDLPVVQNPTFQQRVSSPHTAHKWPYLPPTHDSVWNRVVAAVVLVPSWARLTTSVVLQKTTLVNNGQCLWHCPHTCG
jgi:hypothetical protein